ncbi:MAG: SirB2 family protein [Gammaproteobacteria bacterium]|nr:SirB2 family protein [Gammaproteobacteria bacterium]
MALKIIHQVTVLVSISLFAVRGIWMVQGSGRLQQRWLRIVPHVNDTVLLVSAVGLMIMLGQYPLVQSWLTAKVVALIVYIMLGLIAFRPNFPQTVKVTAWCLAMLVYFYILSVAITKSPTGVLAIW